jgi:uncharacterized protein with HEPN domain
MHRDREHLLRDALLATDKIIRFTANRSFDEYASSDLHVSAVKRQFEILAEALRVAEQVDPSIRISVPELGRIIGMRNLIAQVPPRRRLFDLECGDDPRLASPSAASPVARPMTYQGIESCPKGGVAGAESLRYYPLVSESAFGVG